jgi:hypothetical protein
MNRAIIVGVSATLLATATARAEPAPSAPAGHRPVEESFGIETEGCARCGGKLKVIASIEEPEVIAKIVAHLERTAPEQYQSELPLGARAPARQASLI